MTSRRHIPTPSLTITKAPKGSSASPSSQSTREGFTRLHTLAQSSGGKRTPTRMTALSRNNMNDS